MFDDPHIVQIKYEVKQMAYENKHSTKDLHTKESMGNPPVTHVMTLMLSFKEQNTGSQHQCV